jgi:hypothetical protein
MDANRRSDCNLPPHRSPSGSASLAPLGEVDYVGDREVSNMTRHVPYDEFRKDPAKYMDEAGGRRAASH